MSQEMATWLVLSPQLRGYVSGELREASCQEDIVHRMSLGISVGSRREQNGLRAHLLDIWTISFSMSMAYLLLSSGSDTKSGPHKTFAMSDDTFCPSSDPARPQHSPTISQHHYWQEIEDHEVQEERESPEPVSSPHAPRLSAVVARAANEMMIVCSKVYSDHDNINVELLRLRSADLKTAREKLNPELAHLCNELEEAREQIGF
ncbi:hypothetical protein B0H10DRAFT_1947125 [Mycena sp. CBHHK59/15]|nr:hypothetical protein B0H10DRAFT_1947125 [Mycena sp. CBHHK59/15]